MPRRRFTLLDGMVLIGATALGMTLARCLFSKEDWAHLFDPHRWRPDELAGVAQAFAMPCASCWNLAIVLLRLKSPRPRARRVMTQPGFAAALAATISLVAWEVTWNLYIRLNQYDFFIMSQDFAAFLSALSVGPTVITVWLLMALGGRWRAERSWIDRFGRVLGAYWIASMVVTIWLIST